ncbi:MAG: hypothetical protein ACR2MN_06315 [Acidimicrobiales bacterium]
MAELKVEGDELVLQLSGVEKVEAVHGDLRVPVASVREVEVLEDVIHAVHGIKFPGSRWPGRFMIGTLVHASERRSFAVVHHDTPRGVRVVLEGTAHHEWLVGCADPEAVVARLSLPS